MDRPSRETGRRAGVALIVVGVAFALVLGGMLALAPASSGSHGLGHASATHIAPAATPSVASVHSAAAPSVSVGLQVPVTTYTVLPWTLIFSVTVSNSVISTLNTTIWLNFTDQATHTTCAANNISGLVSDTSSPTAYYNLPVTTALFANVTVPAGCSAFEADVDAVSVAVIENTTTAVTTGGALALTSFILVTPTVALHVAVVSAQTYGLTSTYTAQYSGRVALTIYNPSGGVVLSANFAVTPTVNWTETTAGQYPYTLTLYTAYSTVGFNATGSVNILAGTNTYTNTTTWSNSTLISGLSSGAAGTILLVVGLLVGMIVAMVVGRLVWGGPKTVAPAQPWSGEKAAPAANTCSVCGKSFATPEELAEHGKTEHGMQ